MSEPITIMVPTHDRELAAQLMAMEGRIMSTLQKVSDDLVLLSGAVDTTLNALTDIRAQLAKFDTGLDQTAQAAQIDAIDVQIQAITSHLSGAMILPGATAADPGIAGNGAAVTPAPAGPPAGGISG
jgi:hypothetical protein